MCPINFVRDWHQLSFVRINRKSGESAKVAPQMLIGDIRRLCLILTASGSIIIQNRKGERGQP